MAVKIEEKLICRLMTAWLAAYCGTVLAASANTRPSVAERLALQPQIDAASKAGGGVVRVPEGTHETLPFLLKSNVTLEVPEGCTLMASTNLSEYTAISAKFLAFIRASNATNVAVVGGGRIVGRGGKFGQRRVGKYRLPILNGGPGRPRLLLFRDCQDVRVEDVTLEDSATWTCHFFRCNGVIARRVKIRSYANFNNDGIDIDAKNVLVEDCDIDCEDDAICFKSDDPDFIVENCEVRNCRVSSDCNFIKFGTASHGGFRNINVHDCIVERQNWKSLVDWGARGVPGVKQGAKTGVSAIALEVVDGGIMENVTVRNITIGNGVQTPIFIRAGSRNPPRKGRTTYMRNVLIENVKMTAPAASLIASSITGVKSVRPSNIVLRNIELLYPGGATEANAQKPVPEAEKRYPENRMFDMATLPAWGIYVRHADDIHFENVRMKLLSPDARKSDIVAEDATVTTSHPAQRFHRDRTTALQHNDTDADG